ncbi:MAG TPA: FtsW/RodA/SpoVE family cell cycle protein, partial [Actinotalea sp.]
MATVSPHQVRPGRSLELGLLVVALTIGVGAYALVGLSTSGSLPADIFGYGAGLVALSVGLHLVLRWRAPYADPVILPVVTALNGIGLAMIYRIDIAYAARGKDTSFAERQLGWTALGVVLAAVVLVLLRDHRTLRRYTYTAMIAGLALVVLPLVPGLGANINGARIWIRVAGNSFQPAEVGKIALAIFFAGYLV